MDGCECFFLSLLVCLFVCLFVCLLVCLFLLATERERVRQSSGVESRGSRPGLPVPNRPFGLSQDVPLVEFMYLVFTRIYVPCIYTHAR